MKITSELWQVKRGRCRWGERPREPKSPATTPGSSAASPHRFGAVASRQSRSGMALVITLIMLAVTLVMAVAFLAISRRERNAVTATSDTATARIAADSALAAAQAQIAASILSTNGGLYNYSLLVSTNFQNSYGFNPAAGANPTNVNYDYLANGSTIFNAAEREQNIANLWLLPRAPVYVPTNSLGSNDFRFYLDLNRDGRFEDTGTNVALVNYLGNTNGYGTEVGDPQWIGVLERPDQPHSANNPFIARYAFLAQPIGNSLDLNYIHNQVFNRSANLAATIGASDGYFRNEGVGSWELNLAGFLADLNTNQWDPPLVNFYNYRQPAYPNQGVAFFDAASLLAWRYGNNYYSLAVPLINFYIGIRNAGVDAYTLGNLMTTPVLPALDNAPSHYDSTSVPWVGSDNTNRFFALPDDLFDPAKSSSYFTNRLLSAGTNIDSYDRYTYYRLLDQLGTESSVDDNKLNLNYSNAVVSYTNINGAFILNNVAIVPGAETNLISWRPLDFFSAAADRMIRYYTTNWFEANPTNFLTTYYGITNFPYRIYANGVGLTNFPYYGMTNQIPAFSLTNIPVYLDGKMVYSPAVNRLLQLAANMYDASTNTFFPSVFRPIFSVVTENGYKNIYINGYTYVPSLSGTSDLRLSQPFDAADIASSINDGFVPVNDNIYGVPWIIGAKKGFPNFNEFYMRNAVQLTRKLEVWRTDGATPGALGTNQYFVMSITNQLGFSFWNSYNTNYYPHSAGGNLNLYANANVSMVLSNGVNIYTSFYGNPSPTNFTYQAKLSYWPGSGWNVNPSLVVTARTPQQQSFFWSVTNYPFLPESVYQASTAKFIPVNSNVVPPWDVTTPVPVFPQFNLMTTNNVQAYILDGPNSSGEYNIIDYVQLRGPNGVRNLNNEIADSTTNPKQTVVDSILNGTSMWDTNGYGNAMLPTKGVVNQITVSQKGPAGTVLNSWKQPPNMPKLSLGTTTLPEAEAAYFSGFFFPTYVVNGKAYHNTNLVVQAPYTPTRTVWQLTLWQANDPLVHYLASDLNTITPDTGLHVSDDLVNTPFPTLSLNKENTRYQPWGLNAQMSQVGGLVGVPVDANAYNLRYRDPLVWGSDDWDFPAGKYPTVGWLGRVHRGTPWQTVYLKERNVLAEVGGATGQPQNIGVNTWAQWTGDQQAVNNYYYDAVNSAPVQDSGLFDLFTTRLNDNAAHGALSVNQTHLAAWSALFSGVVALTNTTPLADATIQPSITNLVIQPAGPAGTNSALSLLVNGPDGINATRAAYTNLDGVVGAFEHVGDILRVPAYSEHSPFLNWNNTAQQQAGISDELYEWLPQQTLGLLTLDRSPRFVIYCYGQTLRPAPDGLVTAGGNFFGLITNYQVTAESAVRAVVRVDRHVTQTGTNYTTTVENYNVLPPD